MHWGRTTRWLIATLIPLFLSLVLLSLAHAQGEAIAGSVTLLGWTAEGDAIILASPQRHLYVRLDGTLRPSAAPFRDDLAPLPATDAGPIPDRLARSLGGPGWILGRPHPSPDGRWLVVERAPSGSETMGQSELWLADSEGTPIRRIDGDGAHAPRWSPDGRAIAYLNGDAVWLYRLGEPTVRRIARLPAHTAAEPSGRPLAASSIYTPPETIRVLHHPDNHCRNRPVWAVDEIPFEEYVRRVVPAEVPASWPQAVLRAQAIAARTYAWYQVLRGRADFDVTDWTDFQVMCDATYPASDAAVAATQGQYLAYAGRPILAQYSADNGHPTVSGGPPYLSAVPDPVSLGYTRRGHGHGLSQWGAYRWATQYGWDALQILAHYYTGVEIRNAGIHAPVLLGVTAPWNGWFYNGSGVRLSANATPSEVITRVVFWADGRMIGEDNDPADGWNTTVDLASLAAETTITVSAETAAGIITGENALRLGVDWDRPQGTAILLPPTGPPPTITLGLQGGDTGQAGFQGIGISAGWLWEGETFEGAPGGPITDTEASAGRARWVAAGARSGVWTSPPIRSLPVGRIYRALFRLRSGAPLTPATIARLEVTANAGARLLGLAEVRGIHLQEPDRYQDVPVDFWYDQPSPDGLRLLVRFTGASDLALDRVLVIGYPTLKPPQGEWPLPDGARAGRLTVVASDQAGNASDPRPVSLSFEEMPGPGSWEGTGPNYWITDTTSPNVRITVRARGGFEPAGSACRASEDQGITWGTWMTATADAAAGAITPVTLTCRPAYPREGEGLWVQFRAEDVHGRTGESPPLPVKVDTRPPTVTLQIDGEIGDNGWFVGPVTVTLDVTDAASGVRAVTWRLDEQPWQEWSTPIVVDQPGILSLQVRALDIAGLETRKTLALSIDLEPPRAALLLPHRTTEARFPVHWRGADDASGIASYDVQVRQEGAETWRDWLVSTTERTEQFAGLPRTTYEFRVRARDLAGRVGAWSPPAQITVAARRTYLPTMFRSPAAAE